MYDIVEELGVSGNYTLYWKHPGGSLNVKHLRTDSDILLMVNSLPRHRQLHVFLEEEVEHIIWTDSDIKTDGVEPVTTETHIRTEAVEPITRTDIRTESEDDSEDLDFVVVDSRDGDSGFEESEIDMSDEEGFAHDVHVGIHTEMDCTNLNSDLLGGLPAMTLDDENVGVDDLHSASESDSDGEFTKNRKPRADPTYSSRLLKKDVMADHVYNVSYGHVSDTCTPTSKIEYFKGKKLKVALWKATRATYVKEFEDAMAELKALSVPAFDWLKGKDPEQWSRSHFLPYEQV
ncbi:hypothetical protein V6N13_081252 [Hibiscus sabdariffa]